MNNNYYQNAIFEFRLIDESEVYYPCPICRALLRNMNPTPENGTYMYARTVEVE